MRRIVRLSAVSLALSALFPVSATIQAQTQPSSLPLIASIAPAALEPGSAAFASLPNAPVPAAEPIMTGPALSFARPCHTSASRSGGPDADSGEQSREPCLASPNPYARFLDTTAPAPLTPTQKALLALHNMRDPGNVATIINTAGFTIATDSHTAYGPGWKGFGRNAGYSFLQDATSETFGTFLIPSLTHEDPHYHRMPHASIPRRALHAISRTVMAQSDTGKMMPNFSSLLTYPICTEISNLYVPGVNGNGPSTVARIMTGYATDPIDNLITEFLPDVAKRIHVRVIFVQRVLNPVTSDEYSLP